MKRFVILSLTLLIVGTVSSSAEVLCSNGRFLTTGFVLEESHEEDRWIMSGLVDPFVGDSCLLESRVSGNALILKPLFPKIESCQLKNLSAPEAPREILFLELSKKVIEEGVGYIKIGLDNSFADYGPRALKSFLYCR